MRIYFGIWILSLIIELLFLYNSLERYGVANENSLFVIIIIIITLIVGNGAINTLSRK
jgi:hypothetical protein